MICNFVDYSFNIVEDLFVCKTYDLVSHSFQPSGPCFIIKLLVRPFVIPAINLYNKVKVGT